MSGIGPIQLSADVRDVGEHDRIAHEVGVLELFRLFDRIAALDLLLTEPPNALSPEMYFGVGSLMAIPSRSTTSTGIARPAAPAICSI